MSDLERRGAFDDLSAADTGVPSPSFERDIKNSLKNAVDALVSLQSEEGWWKGELETNVTMDAEDLLLREFLGI